MWHLNCRRLLAHLPSSHQVIRRNSIVIVPCIVILMIALASCGSAGSRTNNFCNTGTYPCIIADYHTNTCAYTNFYSKADAYTHRSTAADPATNFCIGYIGSTAFVDEYRRAPGLSEKRRVCLFSSSPFQIN